MMAEVYRVLKPRGTAWINLGDTYGTRSGNFNAGNQIDNKIKYVGGIENYTKPDNYHKCLLLLPHRFAIGCIDRGWIMRNDIVWAKRNGMPESVTDRFSKKHEFIFFMAKNEKYYFDLDNIRDKQSAVTIKRYDYGWNGNEDRNYVNGPQNNMNRYLGDPKKKKEAIEKGKNPGSVSDFWDITTKPSSEEHYAAYNDELIGKPIVAGCPHGGVILDPFCGTATTGCRALELGRNFIGFDGSKKYVAIANKRIVPYLAQKQLF